mmetsp:Transcript_22518/g.59458  ORF Transcript_22518/g.59458 Transcript_22518/m.59458 type:complete len:211 (+) Transcript_22518:967-1599(+)
MSFIVVLLRKKGTSHVLAHDKIDGGKDDGHQHDPLQRHVLPLQHERRESGGLHQASLPKYLDRASRELSVTQESNALCNRKDHRLGCKLQELMRTDGAPQTSGSVKTQRGETTNYHRQKRLHHGNALTHSPGSLQCLARENGLADVNPHKETESKHLQEETHVGPKPTYGLWFLALELLFQVRIQQRVLLQLHERVAHLSGQQLNHRATL